MTSFEKVFSIIDYLQKYREARLQDIYTCLDMTKSTAHRLLSTLATHNFVKRNNETKKYSLGVGFLRPALSVLEGLDVRKVAAPYLDRINQKTHETVHLAMLLDDHVVYVDKRESRHMVRMFSLVGKFAPVHCTGVGKAIMAYQDEETVDRVLSQNDLYQFTSNTIVTQEQLKKELREICYNGFALDREEHEENIICIAAPIYDHTGSVSASMSITTLLHRMKLKELLNYKEDLLEVCGQISQELGYINLTEEKRKE
jgi:DNA-binding IclR family transcriptional regulator